MFKQIKYYQAFWGFFIIGNIVWLITLSQLPLYLTPFRDLAIEYWDNNKMTQYKLLVAAEAFIINSYTIFSLFLLWKTRKTMEPENKPLLIFSLVFSHFIVLMWILVFYSIGSQTDPRW